MTQSLERLIDDGLDTSVKNGSIHLARPADEEQNWMKNSTLRCIKDHKFIISRTRLALATEVCHSKRVCCVSSSQLS